MSTYQTTNRHTSTSTEITREREENRTLRRRGTAGLAVMGAAVLTAVVAGNVLHDNGVKHAEQQKAFEKIDTPVFKTIVLRGGTQLRLTPKELTVDSSSGDTANLAGEIPKDEVWITQAPLVDLNNPQWVAITKPGAEKDIHSAADRIDQTVWVHYGPFLPSNKGGAVDWGVNEQGMTSVNNDLTPLVESTFKADMDSINLLDALVDRK